MMHSGCELDPVECIVDGQLFTDCLQSGCALSIQGNDEISVNAVGTCSDIVCLFKSLDQVLCHFHLTHGVYSTYFVQCSQSTFEVVQGL